MHKGKIPSKGHFDINFQVIDKKTVEEAEKQKMKSLKTGTTTVGLVCKDGVVLATDKRATMGYFIASPTAQKLHMIQPYLWITIAGGVADAQYLIDLLKAETEIYNLQHPENPISPRAAAKLLSNILYQKKGFYQVGHLLGGYDGEKGYLFDIGGYGSVLPEKFASVGSGSPFAIGVLEAKYHDDITVEEGMKVCAAAVRSAIIRDIASGNGIDVVGITKNGYVEKSYSIKEDPLKPQ